MAIKQYKNREEVPAKYKWDLEAMLKGKTAEEVLKEWEKQFKKYIGMKDSMYESKEAFLKALKLNDQVEQLQYIAELWGFLRLRANVVDADASAYLQNFSLQEYKLKQELGPEEPRIFANQKKIESYLEGKEFEVYRSKFRRLFEAKKHQLSNSDQEFRNKESRADINARQVFEILYGAEIDYGFVKPTKGKQIKVTAANRTLLLENNDEKVRKGAFYASQKAILKNKETFSNLLFQHFKKETVWAGLKKFDNVIEYLTFEDRASEKLLTSLYSSVQSHVDLRKQYLSTFSKVYKAKYGVAPKIYDRFRSVLDVKTEITIEQMQKQLLETFKPYGKEYVDTVKRAFEERWIDYHATPNKHSGAFAMAGTYALDKKYILMNFAGNVDSVNTLSHELGHAMHSYFSDKSNAYSESAYSIFVAEIASIFNELMYSDYLLRTSEDDLLKLKIRQHTASRFNGAVFTQTEWSNYEYDMYKGIEQGKPYSSYTEISKVYYENSKKYNFKEVKFKPEDQYPAIMVPHFYYGFYVYKYAIGQLVANIFFQRYKEQGEEALQDYIKNFLSAGSRMNPLEVLKANGIDLEDPKTYEQGFAPAYENLKEFKKLAKKVFKI